MTFEKAFWTCSPAMSRNRLNHNQILSTLPTNIYRTQTCSTIINSLTPTQSATYSTVMENRRSADSVADFYEDLDFKPVFKQNQSFKTQKVY